MPETRTHLSDRPEVLQQSIQPRGYVLICDHNLDTIAYVSENLPALFGTPAADVAGATLESFLGVEAVHQLRNCLAKSPDPSRAGVILGFQLENGPLVDLSLHFSNDSVVIEIERASTEAGSSPMEIARGIFARVRGLKNLSALYKQVPRLAGALFGFDRATLIRIGPEGQPQVLGASDRNSADVAASGDLSLLLADRSAYLNVPVRFIADATLSDIAIIAVDARTVTAPSLHFAHLAAGGSAQTSAMIARGTASMLSLSLVSDDQLWGVILCESTQPRHMPLAQVMAAELFADFLALKITALTPV